MQTPNWWIHVQPHKDIREGRVDETLFAANLGGAIEGQGPAEYSDPEIFFRKTFLARLLRELLIDILRRLAGQQGMNPIVVLQTNFGGGKTHAELAIYHLLKHPDKSLLVPQVRDLVDEAGVSAPPACHVAVLPCSTLNPLGRTTREGVRIHTLWGEMAYQLGGKELYGLIASNDGQLASPGDAALAKVLQAAGACVILIDETLHYVNKVSHLRGAEGSLASETVAFLRELTDAVAAVPRCMLVLSLTGGATDQLGDDGMQWLARMNQEVIREAKPRAPVEGTEIYEIVRQRLFEQVDGSVAHRVAKAYHQLYCATGALPGHLKAEAYRELIERSYPLHPELVTILYERWGSKPTFQLTRGTLRLLALLLQDLWGRRSEASPDLIQPGDVSLGQSDLRAILREVAGDPQWESVVASDIAAARNGQPAKAQLMDQERRDGGRYAEAMAATIMLYSQGGGENPFAARHDLRLACARPGFDEALWDSILEGFRTRLFYFYSDEGKYRFRKEPNVLSLHHTYKTNMQESEISAFLAKTIPEKALGPVGASHGFAGIYSQPEDSTGVPDDDDLKLIALDFARPMQEKEFSEKARDAILSILERRGQVLRQRRNRLVFAVADEGAGRGARALACDYLAWRKVEANKEDWDRIGAPQQALVKEQRAETEGATLKALISAYTWAVVPSEDPTSGQLTLRPVRLGAYGPGKLVAPMVWDRLTSENGHGERILTALTPDTLLERYGPRAWPETELWITTTQLWDRFAKQVGLPILARSEVLLDTAQIGQREELFAVGHLVDEKSPRDKRDSYLSLDFKVAALPPSVPALGERWLLMRPSLYWQIVGVVTPDDIVQAVRDLSADGEPVRLSGVYAYIRKSKDGKMDDASFCSAVAFVAKRVHETRVGYRAVAQGPDVAEVPQALEELLRGFVVIKRTHWPPPPPPPPPEGRTITIRGALASLDKLATLYKRVLQALNSQKPSEFTLGLEVRVRFDSDPGAGLDATLEDGFTSEDFPGLTLTDSKKQ